MAKQKIHIDQLFSKGLENLEFPLMSADFDTVNDALNKKTAHPFEDFELPVSNDDWAMIQLKLEAEKVRLAGIPLPTDEMARTNFKDFEIAVTDSDWKAIQNKMGNGGREKMIWWWWLNVLVISAILGLTLNHYLPPVSAKNTTAAIDNHSNTVSASKQNIIVERNNATGNTTNERANESVNTPNPVAQNTHIVAGEINTPVQNKPVRTTNNINRVTATSAVASAPKTKPSISNKTFETTPTPVTEIPNTAPEGLSPKGNIEQATPKNNTPATAPLKTTETPEQTASNVSEDHLSTQRPEKTTEGKENIVQALPLDMIAPPNPADTSKKKANTENQKPPLPKKFIPHFYFGFNTALENHFRKLDRTNPAAYNAIRNGADKAYPGVNFGLVAGLQLKNMQIQTGVQSVTQHFTSVYNYTYKVYDSIPFKDPNGKIIGYFLKNPRDTSINSSESVTIKNISVPLSFNYTKTLNAKTALIFGGSAVLNFKQSATGTYMINPANRQLYPYLSLKRYENNFGVSPGIQLGLQTKLYKNFSVQGTLNGSYSMSNRFKPEFGVKENLYNYGLSLKLLYLLQ